MSDKYSRYEKMAFGLIVAGMIVLGISIVLFLFRQPLGLFSMPIDVNKFGGFGEFVGGLIGSLWTLATIILLYLTLTLQRQELHHQSEQLEILRKEFELQINGLRNQTEMFNQERIESTLFNLLSMHHEIVRSMEIKVASNNKTENKHGRDCFLALYRIFKDDYYDNELGILDDQERINATSLRFFNKYQESLGHYLRTLYNIFMFLDNCTLSKKMKDLYAKIIHAQLSNYELLLLFYTGNYKYGNNFKTYATQYQLFDNIVIDKLFDPTNHPKLYQKEAFGSSLDE